MIPFLVTLAAVGLVACAVSFQCGRWFERDRRAAPVAMVPSVRQLRLWDDERKTAGLRVLRGGRRG